MVGVIATDFGLTSETSIGNITAIFLFLGGFLAFVWVFFEDRLAKRSLSSRKQLLLLATTIWIGGLFLTCFSQNYIQLFIYQMITAVGYAAITPLAFSMAMDLAPQDQRAKTFGLLDIAALVGSGVGFLLAGMLIDFCSWKIPFLIIAIGGLIISPFVFRIRDPKKGIHDRELTHVLADGAEYSYHIDRQSLKYMITCRSNLLIVIFNITLYMASGSITYYFIRMMVHDHGFSSSLAVLFFLVTYGFQLVGCLWWTKRADRKFSFSKKGKVKVLLESLLTGPIFLIIAYSLVFTLTNGILLGIFGGLLVLGAFLVSGLVAISFSILGEVNPPEIRTTIFSMNNLAQTIGRGGGILLMGIFFKFFGDSYHMGFAVMCGFYICSIPLIILLLRYVPRDLALLSILLQKRADELEENKIDSETQDLSFETEEVSPQLLENDVRINIQDAATLEALQLVIRLQQMKRKLLS